MTSKAVDLAQRLLKSLSAEEELPEEVPEVMGPTMAEIAARGLSSVFPCCARLSIPAGLLEALAAKIGAPRGDYSIYLLQQLTQSERDDTVEGLVLTDGRQPSRPRHPSLFEKSQIRSLFVLVDQVAMTLAAHRRLRDQGMLGDGPSGVPRADEANAARSPVTGDEPPLGGVPAPEDLAPRVKRRKRSKAERATGEAAGGTAQPTADDWAREAPSPLIGHGGTAQSTADVWARETWPAPVPPEHPKRKGKLYVTTPEGAEVCFSYAKNGEGACQEPCPQGRAHVCQICFGPHRNEWHRRWAKWKARKTGEGA